jgi:hypothetical protein
MRISYLRPFILLFVTAVPTAHNKRELHGKIMPGACTWDATKDSKKGGVYFCSNPGISGQCTWERPTDRCIVPAFVPKSIGPDLDGWCTTHTDKECKSEPISYMQGMKQSKIL